MADNTFQNKLSFDEFPPVSKEEWESAIQKDLKGKDYKEELLWKSVEGFQVYPFYSREDLEGLAHSTEPVAHEGDWHVLECLDIDDLTKANLQALDALENGATGLFIEIPESRLRTEKDLEILFNHILLNHIPVHFSEKSSTSELLHLLEKYCSRKKYDAKDLNLFFSFDPFSEALRSGKLHQKEHIIHRLHEISRPFHNYGVNATIIGESGGSIIQQIAYALAAGNEYLNTQEVRDADMHELAQKIHFHFSVATGFFPEIAKFRAFRILWGQILNAYENNLADEVQIHIHAGTALWNKPRRDAYNNMIRSTTESMSAAIGGCNYISVERFDKNWAPPSAFASRIARNTQLILKHESYLQKVADAGAGAYYIEQLTDEIALKSWELFQEIEKAGGLHEAMKSGMFQDLVSESCQQKVEAYKNNHAVMVGLNKFQSDQASSELPDWKIVSPTSLFTGDTESIEPLAPFNLEKSLE